MKEQLLELVRSSPDSLAAGSLAREYLQSRILFALQEAGAMIPLAFQGGTALRFLFALPRFSEDLDFALERPGRASFDFARTIDRVTTQLRRERYDVVATERTERVVQSAMLRFSGILHEAGVTPHETQRLNIRIEVDTRPPQGAALSTTIVRRHAVLNLQHHDRASLLAGKLHALLQRPWTKGRDLFDLFWYASDPTWPGPNLVLLNNALRQTGWEGGEIEASNWRGVVADRVRSLDWRTAERDVAPFLEPGSAASLFSREALLQIL